ncbi:MAG: hypothetical protein VB018_04305 [Lachnospiraceae bacterium]|nr:hypothetical protein [Lachnospiraceae bacterium]
MYCNEFNYNNGTLGAWVDRIEVGSSVHTVYNNYTLKANKVIDDYANNDGLTVPNGATLTINKDVILEVIDASDINGVPQITNLGTIINNGTIQLPADTTNEMLPLKPQTTHCGCQELIQVM